MKIAHISSQSIASALRYSTMNLQRQMIDAQTEATTGQVADAGLTLGVWNGKRVAIASDVERFNAIIDTNSVASTRLGVSQGALEALGEQAQTLLTAIASDAGGSSQASITVEAARAALSDLTSLLNTGFNGEYIFAGLNTDVAPIADYEGGPAEAAFDTAFTTFFGFAKTDPAAASITRTDMETFLTTVVEPMFTGPDWLVNMSSASDEGIRSRITLTETATTSVSANEQGPRRLMLAAVVATELLGNELGASARDGVSQYVMQTLGEATGDVAVLQGRVGFVEQQLQAASDRLRVQADQLTLQADDLVSVDPYEAATRLTSLLTQIESSYALTSRIQQLSLMRFL